MVDSHCVTFVVNDTRSDHLENVIFHSIPNVSSATILSESPTIADEVEAKDEKELGPENLIM